MNILLINGPPYAGKDLFGDLIHNEIGETSTILKFAAPLSDMTKYILGVDAEYFNDLLGVSSTKDGPLPLLGVKTSLRKIQIDLSEKVIKPNLSNYWFADKLIQEIHKLPNTINTIIVTDSGFNEEVNRLKQFMGDENNIKIIQLRRRDCNFDNDSREYVDDPNWVIHNNGPPRRLLNKWLSIKRKVMNG